MASYYTHEGYRLNGWRYDIERRQELARTSTDVGNLLRSRLDTNTPDSFDPRGLFANIDPRGKLQLEDQGRQGSCAGQAGSSVAEYVHLLESRRAIQLSRGGLYYMAQAEDGITGDRGSTINGCSEVLRKIGVPPERDWPYPDVYDPEPPNGIEYQHRKAQPYKIGSHTWLRSSREVMQYLKKGIGGIQIGIIWGGEVDENGVFRWRPQGGGHSVALFGHRGNDYTYLFNSWGDKWGDNGWALVHVQTLDQMLSHDGSVFVGYSDMGNPDHQRDLPVDFTVRPTV